MSRDASARARGTENGPAVAQIAGVFATKSEEIERCKHGSPREDGHLIESQCGICGSNEPFSFYLSPVISTRSEIGVVGPADAGKRDPLLAELHADPVQELGYGARWSLGLARATRHSLSGHA